MKKIFWISLICLLLLVPNAQAANKMYWATGLTGGGDNLDGIDGNDITVGDGAVVVLDSGSTIPVIYFYRAYESGSAESSPNIISPDSNPGNKRWHIINTAFTSGLAAALPGTCTAGAAYFATDTKTLYVCSAANTQSAVVTFGADGTWVVNLPNNTSDPACAAGDYNTRTYNGAIQTCNNGSKDTIATLTATQTLTNKTLTAPITTLPRVDGSAALSLTAEQVSGTVIRNTGQVLGDVNHTLPVAAAGYNFVAFVGTTLAATNYWRFTANTTPTPDDFMCLDGTCGKTYVSVDTPTQGDTLTCYTEQVSSTGMKTGAALAIGGTTTAVYSAAFQFDIAGTGYAKAEVAAGTAPGNDVIPEDTYGAVAFDIGADGTIDAVEATDNATGYASAALAVAGLPAVAASHTRMGYVTAMKSDGAFTFGTTALNAANTTVAYTSSSVYTPPFNWICITGKGTWTTD